MCVCVCVCVCVLPNINMHPQRVSMANVCDGIKRIEGSIHRGACCRIYVEWNQTLEERAEVSLVISLLSYDCFRGKTYQ